MVPVDRVGGELAAAAAVRAAREDVIQALGPLAACPLDEQAVDQMRRALAAADSVAVRLALRQLIRHPGARASLASVPDVGLGDDGPVGSLGPEELREHLGGGAA